MKLTLYVIKKTNEIFGTVDWLAAGLEEGTLLFREDFVERHGLYFSGPENNDCIAAYNPNSNDPSQRYEILDGWRDPRMTDACWDSIVRAAGRWVDARNAELEKEKTLEIELMEGEE